MATATSTRSDIQHIFGPIEDHLASEILELRPTLADLEVAAAYAAGMTDVMGEVRRPLSGNAARIYDIVSRDAALAEEDDRRG
jgi:hypothetical protein